MTSVFVIHGVHNRDEERFKGIVASLQTHVRDDLELVPVFWGHLGAKSQHLDQVIPRWQPPDETRGGAPNPARNPTPFERAMLSALDDRDGPADGAPTGPPASVRGNAHDYTNVNDLAEHASRNEAEKTAWQSALREEWENTPYLRSIRDPQILKGLGDGLREDRTGTVHTTETRGASDWMRQRIRDVENAISVVVGATAGRFNNVMRNKIGPDFASFAGDVVVYHRNQRTIQDEVWKVLKSHGDAGTEGNPAYIVGHSLGGVIALDMCTDAERPLHLSGFVTFGSQWPFFNLIDPRSTVPPFEGSPSPLPASLHGGWINLWEPLDPLAFVAANVLTLHDGSLPEDRQQPYDVASGIWTHSSYWNGNKLFEAINEVVT